MKIQSTNFNGLKVIKGRNHFDKRGYFREVYKNNFLKKKFVLWCVSRSKKNVIRGLHIQKKISQNILVSVLKGKVFDVVIDLRKKSKTYGKCHYITLSEKNAISLYIPAGFAHGFYSISSDNLVLYGISKYHSKKNEVGIMWNDESLKIKWPSKNPIISIKDKKNISFKKYNRLYF